ncbi:hypothetical protein IAR50_002271 [Cryptococcus sp. DSM 104548]
MQDTATLPPVGDEATRTSPPPQPPTTGKPLNSGFSLSHWLQTVRNNPLLDHRTTDSLPTEADVVVIGSGISGSLCAKTLLESENSPKSVVLLEARELSSGATGRNAGHCKPDQWRGFTRYNELHGTDQALKILANEQQTWEALVDYVKKNDVQCDLWVGKTLDVCMSDEVAATAAKTFSDYKAAGGDTSKIEVTTDPSKAEEISRIKGAKSVYAWDASTLHPWKLVAHIVQRALDLGLNLQTWTPVSSVTGSAHQWTVHTERGDIKTSKVVHCTNAYAGVLLPETKGAINPTPHMCNRVIPPTSHSGSKALRNSYAVLFPTGMFSINPRSTSDGAVLFGGSATNQYKLFEYIAGDPEKRRVDDGLVNFEPVTEAVRTLGTQGFEWDLAPGVRGTAARYDYAWSGIIGRSADHLPFIGAVPGKPGQYMSCGHNGHGMARTFTCSRGLAQIIQGAAWRDTGLPESFEVSQERLDKLRKMDVVIGE